MELTKVERASPKEDIFSTANVIAIIVAMVGFGGFVFAILVSNIKTDASTLTKFAVIDTFGIFVLLVLFVMTWARVAQLRRSNSSAGQS